MTTVAWARLPALIRIPNTRPELENILREHGATSRIVSMALPHEEIIEIIQDALSQGLDFKWGLANDKQADR